MNTPILLGIARHLLTIGAGALATRGVIGENEVEITVGSVLGIIGIILSAVKNQKAKRELESR